MRIKTQTTSVPYYAARASLIVVLVSLFIINGFLAQAADLSSRQLRLGTSQAGATTTHEFSFNNPSAAVLGSIKFEYCSNSPLFSEPCTPPAGLNLAGVLLDNQTGNVGFIVDGLSNANTIILSRAPAGALSAPNTYEFSNAVNPSAVDTTNYVRISLYSTNDTSGLSFDSGALAFSTSGAFSIGLYVPPFLIFCTGVTVSSDCSSALGNFVTFGEFSPNLAVTATTQFAVATNDESGHQVFVNGQTMTSGNNIIPLLSSRTASNPGVGQFGINLRSNSNPSVGADRSGVGTTTVNSNYNSPNQFKLTDGDVVVSSPLPSNFNVFTVSYIVNINENQAPGFYATTLLFTAVATF